MKTEKNEKKRAVRLDVIETRKLLLKRKSDFIFWLGIFLTPGDEVEIPLADGDSKTIEKGEDMSLPAAAIVACNIVAVLEYGETEYEYTEDALALAYGFARMVVDEQIEEMKEEKNATAHKMMMNFETPWSKKGGIPWR